MFLPPSFQTKNDVKICMKNIFPRLSYDFLKHDLPDSTQKPSNCDTEKSQTGTFIWTARLLITLDFVCSFSE